MRAPELSAEGCSCLLTVFAAGIFMKHAVCSLLLTVQPLAEAIEQNVKVHRALQPMALAENGIALTSKGLILRAGSRQDIPINHQRPWNAPVHGARAVRWRSLR